MSFSNRLTHIHSLPLEKRYSPIISTMCGPNNCSGPQKNVTPRKYCSVWIQSVWFFGASSESANHAANAAYFSFSSAVIIDNIFNFGFHTIHLKYSSHHGYI